MTSPPDPLDILHVDNHLLVVRKPAGLPTVPDSSGDPSLLDLGKEWLQVEFDKPGNVFLGVVHRLDRPVSGVVCFARTSKAAGRLQPAFAKGCVTKTYWAVTEGKPPGDSGQVDHWLWKDRARNTVRVVAPETPDAKRARTDWKVLEHRGGRTLLELRPHTGRSHQLRVATSSLGMVLLGDLRYGAERPLEDKSVALHARSLELDHPVGGAPLRFLAAPPDLAVWRFGTD